jgi:hypothetical protein
MPTNRSAPSTIMIRERLSKTKKPRRSRLSSTNHFGHRQGQRGRPAGSRRHPPREARAAYSAMRGRHPMTGVPPFVRTTDPRAAVTGFSSNVEPNSVVPIPPIQPHTRGSSSRTSTTTAGKGSLNTFQKVTGGPLGAWRAFLAPGSWKGLQSPRRQPLVRQTLKASEAATTRPDTPNSESAIHRPEQSPETGQCDALPPARFPAWRSTPLAWCP